jgi:hypothetical protein
VTVNPLGGSGEEDRDTWCTPKWFADLLGPVDLDPATNERSHIQARRRCYGRTVGTADDGLAIAALVDPTARVFINPPYSRGSVIAWVGAYSHVDFMFLVRFDSSTEWFSQLISYARYAWLPLGRRMEFEPPPGVEASSSPFPHAIITRSAPPQPLLAHGVLFKVEDLPWL